MNDKIKNSVNGTGCDKSAGVIISNKRTPNNPEPVGYELCVMSKSEQIEETERRVRMFESDNKSQARAKAEQKWIEHGYQSAGIYNHENCIIVDDNEEFHRFPFERGEIMDNKEQARVKAERYVIIRAYKQRCIYINTCTDRFELFNSRGRLQIKFPFADLKDGDACMCDDNSFKNLFYYYNDAFYDGFRNGRFQDECPNVTLITKTGFNILEHLEGEK